MGELQVKGNNRSEGLRCNQWSPYGHPLCGSPEQSPSPGVWSPRYGAGASPHMPVLRLLLSEPYLPRLHLSLSRWLHCVSQAPALPSPLQLTQSPICKGLAPSQLSVYPHPRPPIWLGASLWHLEVFPSLWKLTTCCWEPGSPPLVPRPHLLAMLTEAGALQPHACQALCTHSPASHSLPQVRESEACCLHRDLGTHPILTMGPQVGSQMVPVGSPRI